MEAMQLNFDEETNDLRRDIKNIAATVLFLKEHKQKTETDGEENIGEIMANLTLCYRHLEDASMRLGKVLQHRNGGVSIYDKNVVGSPEK